MKFADFAKALGVAVFVLVVAIAASFPMVAVYAYLIEPGHPPEFYTEAANWIAPWSSYVLGPIVFFACNYWLAKTGRVQFPLRFAALTIGCYVLVDLGSGRFGPFQYRRGYVTAYTAESGGANGQFLWFSEICATFMPLLASAKARNSLQRETTAQSFG